MPDEAQPPEANEHPERPRVVAVVLTWNDSTMTARCVKSVLDNRYPAIRTVVSDNGSSPPVVPTLRGLFPDLDCVELDHNYGFTGGCNRGMERALELGADYVFLLNNDTIVHPEAIGYLVETMEAQPDVGMASAILLFPGSEQRIQFCEGHVLRDCARHVHPGENETLDDGHRRLYACTFAPACAVMFRREALNRTGMFDERLFTNWEDYDLCCRLLDDGWRIVTDGRAEVVHEHGRTTGRISPFITYFFTRNRLICLFRYGRMIGIIKHMPHIARSFYWQIREYGYDNWPAHRAFLKGLAHFMMGIRGEGNAPKERRDRGAG